MTYKYDKPNSCLVQQPEMGFMPVHPTDEHLLTSVPMDILNEKWAERNHSQSLQRLKERGGLSLIEMAANVNRVSVDMSITNEQALSIIEKNVASLGLITLPLQSIPEGWVDGQVVVEGKDFEISFQVRVVGNFIPVSKMSYDESTGEERRILAIPILPAQEGKEEKGEDENEVAFNKWETLIPDILRKLLSDFALEHTYPVRGILRNLFKAASTTPSPSESNSNEAKDEMFNAFICQSPSGKVALRKNAPTGQDAFAIFIKIDEANFQQLDKQLVKQAAPSPIVQEQEGAKDKRIKELEDGLRAIIDESGKNSFAGARATQLLTYKK